MRTAWDPGELLAELAACGEGCATPPFRIDANGGWWHEGRPIRRPELVRLFATALWRAPDGRYWLLTPVERVPVEVEDAPFLAVAMVTDGEGPARKIRMRTNINGEVTLDDRHPLLLRHGPGGTPLPYLQLERGLEARLTRAVYYELAELALEDGGDPPGVWSCGCFFPLMSEGE